MKTILVLSDFSIRAQYAAEYAYSIARNLEADIILCHAMEVVESAPMAEQIAWPVADHIALQEESLTGLKDIVANLKLQNQHANAYVPKVTCICEFGRLSTVTETIIKAKKIDLVVMGSHRSSGLSRFLFGCHTHDVLDNLDCPVLLVPESYTFNGLRSIAYASDLTFSDLKVIKYIMQLAKPFQSEILVSHVSPYGSSEMDTEKVINHYSAELFDEENPRVFYTSLKGDNVTKRLLEVMGNGKADLLTLVHKQYGLLESLFHSSISKQLANAAKVPLLILPYSFSIDVADLSNSNLEHYCYAPDESR